MDRSPIDNAKDRQYAEALDALKQARQQRRLTEIVYQEAQKREDAAWKSVLEVEEYLARPFDTVLDG